MNQEKKLKLKCSRKKVFIRMNENYVKYNLPSFLYFRCSKRNLNRNSNQVRIEFESCCQNQVQKEIHIFIVNLFKFNVHK